MDKLETGSNFSDGPNLSRLSPYKLVTYSDNTFTSSVINDSNKLKSNSPQSCEFNDLRNSKSRDESKYSHPISDYLKLQQFSAEIKPEKKQTELEYKNFKINLKEFATDLDKKTNSMQMLKLKIPEQHVDIQNYLKTNEDLTEKLNFLNTKFEESEKLKLWYKEQLMAYRNNQIKLKEEVNNLKELKARLEDKVSSSNINLIKYKIEIEDVRLKALKENQKLNKKIEKTNLDYSVLLKNNNNYVIVNNSIDVNVDLNTNLIDDLKEEISRIKATTLKKDREFHKLSQENSNLMSKYVISQMMVRQKEFYIELLECNKKELIVKLEFLKNNEKEMLIENSYHKNKLSSLEIELKMRNQENMDVAKSVQLIIHQIEKFKADHEISTLKEENEKCHDEMKNKDKLIFDLKNKLQKFENDWQNYVERITNDDKVQLLNSQTNPTRTDISKFIDDSFQKLNIDEFESVVDVRLKYSDERIRKIQKKMETIQEKLNDKVKQNKIEELEIRLRVKQREMDQKRTNMDRDNRTLLRKVKEHLKGRHFAENQLRYLQDLYNSLADYNSKLKLSITSKDIEIEMLQNSSNSYKIDNEKLKKAIIELDIELQKTNTCYNSEFEASLEKLKEDLEEAAEKENYLCLQEKIQSSNIQQKVEYSQELEAQIVKLEKEHEYFKKTVNDYENKINLLHNEIKISKDCNFFLRQLSSDLEVALKSTQEQNKRLQQQLKLFGTEKPPIKKLTIDILDEFNSDDEKYINNLLEEHRSSVGIKLMDDEMHDILRQLRQGISNIQDQIHKKE